MFNYRWLLKSGYPAPDITKHNKKVFTTFACGGGSSMGYKLAGYDVIAANDIDSKMEKIYQENHHPKYFYLESISTLHQRTDLPEELFDIDLLDGSPPCSTFSISGQREKNWGKQKKFREGQSKQVLDDLFFEFIQLVKKIKPKIVISENVKGMLQGNAKGYVIEIKKQFDDAGYNTQVFLLNSASMGVPQRRERVFFLSSRKDLNLPPIKLSFNEKPILFKEISENRMIDDLKLSKSVSSMYPGVQPGTSFSKIHPRGSFFNCYKVSMNEVCATVTAAGGGGHMVHPQYPRNLSDQEYMLASSFPLDYNFIGQNVKYIVGMSVPPVMMAQVSNQVYQQWLSKI